MGPIVSMAVAAVVGALVAMLFVVWSRSRVPGEVPPTMAEVRRLHAAGRKIEAIKIYRNLHGVGLKEAKEAVERL